MLTQTAGHIFAGKIAASQDDVEHSALEPKLLSSLIGPWPFGRIVAVDEHCGRVARVVHVPRIEPTVAMQRTWIPDHVRLDSDRPTPEVERAAADPVYIGD